MNLGGAQDVAPEVELFSPEQEFRRRRDDDAKTLPRWSPKSDATFCGRSWRSRGSHRGSPRLLAVPDDRLDYRQPDYPVL